jgi:methyltransferase-like protein 6
MIPEFWQQKYRKESGKSWDLFYRRNGTRFFKDRHWIVREFPEAIHAKVLLEVGCGVGNFILPLLQEREEEGTEGQLFACDFSATAIDLLKKDPRYKEPAINAFVCNIASDDIHINPTPLINAIALVFVLSAIPPECHLDVFRKLSALLSSDGVLLFRDYADDDAAQQRFKSDRYMGGRLWVRQDGTLAYYFTIEEISNLAEQAGFSVKEIKIVERETVNRELQLSLDRKFIQAKLLIKK